MANYDWYNGYSYPYSWRKNFSHHEYGQAGYARPNYSNQNGYGVYPRLESGHAWDNWNTHGWGNSLDYGNWAYSGVRNTRRTFGNVDSSLVRARNDWFVGRY